MIKLKTCVTIVIAIIFAILLKLSIDIERDKYTKYRESVKCGWNDTLCMSICTNTKSFTVEELEKKIANENIPGFDNKTEKVVIKDKALECSFLSKKKSFDADYRDRWRFYYVRMNNFFRNGNIYLCFV